MTQPKDTSGTTTVVRDIEGDQIVLRPAREGEAEELRRLGQGWRVSERDSGAYRNQQREAFAQELGVDGPVATLGTAAMGVVDGALGFGSGAGLATAATHLLPPAVRAYIEESRRRHPYSSLFGDVLGAGSAAVLSGGAAGGGRALGAAGSLARMTPAGLAALFGEQVAGRVGASLAARGVAQGTARSAGLLAGAGAEGLADDSIEVVRRYIEDPSRTGEEIMGGFGLGGLIGLGIGAGFVGGGRALRGLTRTRARELANGLPDSSFASRALQSDLRESSGLGRMESVISRTGGVPDASPITAMRARVAAMAGFGNEDAIRAMSQREFQLAYGRANNELQGRIDSMTQALNGIIESTGEMVPDLNRRSTRLQQAVADLPLERIQPDALDRLAAVQSRWTEALTDSAPGLTQVAQRFDGLTNRVMNVIEDAPSTARVVEALEQFRTAIRDAAAVTPPSKFASESGAITGFQRSESEQLNTTIQAMLDDIAGEDAGLIGRFREAERRYFAQQRQVLQAAGLQVAEDGVRQRRLTNEKVRSMVDQAARSEGDGTLVAQIDSYLREGETYRDLHRQVYGADPAQADAMRLAEETIRDNFADARRMAEAQNFMREQTFAEAERRGVGVASGAATLGTQLGASLGLLGGVVGGLPGAAAGFAGSALLASVVRPASYGAQVAHMRMAIDGLLQRRGRAFSALRTSLTQAGGGSRMQTTGGAGTRGVPVAVNRLRSASRRREEYEQYREEIRELATNPRALQNRIDHMAGGLGEVSSDVLGETSLAAMRGIKWVYDHLPAEETTPFGRQRPPSLAQIDDLLRRIHAIEDPYSIVDQAAAGRISRVSVDTVRAVYPRLYQQIMSETANILGDLENPPTYQARMAVGQLLQMPVDPTLEPSFLNEMQNLRQQSRGAAEANGTTRTARNIAFRSGDTLYSSSQEISQRL